MVYDMTKRNRALLLPLVMHLTMTSPSHSFLGTIKSQQMLRRTSNSTRTSTVVQRMSACGYCVRCGVDHSLPTTSEARAAAMELVQRMEATGRVDLDLRSDERLFVDPMRLLCGMTEQPPSLQQSAKRSSPIPTSVLTDARGKMLGVLVCAYGDTGTTVVLCAFAGALEGRWHVHGWVPPVGGGSPEEIPKWEEIQSKVTETSRQMANLGRSQEHPQQQYHNHGGTTEQEQHTSAVVLAEKKEEWARLRARRAAFSSEALKVLRANQRVGDFRGSSSSMVRVARHSPLQDVASPSSMTTKTLEAVYLESMDHRQRQRQQTLDMLHVESEISGNGSRKKQSKAAKKRKLRRMPPLAHMTPHGPITKGMPVGVGECCATKLIAFCADHNRRVTIALHNTNEQQQLDLKLLRPVGIAEVFFGTSKQTQRPREDKGFPSESATATTSLTLKEAALSTRVGAGSSTTTTRKKQVKNLVDNDGVFYDACELRCQPVLGFMLCGLEDMDSA